MRESDRERLCWLIDALVENRATAEEVRELENLAGTPEGRQLYLDYLLLHGELTWGLPGALAGAAGREAVGVPSAVIVSPCIRPEKVPSFWEKSLTFGMVLAMVVVVLAGIFGGFWRQQPAVPDRPVAEVVGQFAAEFADPSRASGIGLLPGDQVTLKAGLAKWRSAGGVEWIAEGPTTLRLEDKDRLTLERGKLVVNLGESKGRFLVQTPHAEIEDRGTAFAVKVTQQTTDIHVLTGQVAVRTLSQAGGMAPRIISGGEALQAGFHGNLSDTDFQGETFWTDVPAPGSVAAYRFSATRHDKLWFCLPFEQQSSARQVALGETVDVVPVLMKGTFDPLTPRFVPGFDGQSLAVAAVRGSQSGNSVGLGWQTGSPLRFPRRFSVEMIFRFDGWPDRAGDAVGCLLAARSSPTKCGFLVAVIPDGSGDRTLAAVAHLLDARHDWTLTRGRLLAGRWYYLASSFQDLGHEQGTRIRTFLVDLADMPGELPLVFDGVVAGQVTHGLLGIGKGFDDRLTHAYPFSGAIDEVCLYNDSVEEATWQKHLNWLCRKGQPATPIELPD